MDARALWPRGTTAPINHWGFLAGRLLGHELHDEPMPVLSRPLLIGIRGVNVWGIETHPLRHVAAYDDTFVSLSPDKSLLVFKGATHAFQKNSKASTDVDGDGVGDVASIDPGRYVLTYKGGKYPVFELTLPNGEKRIPCTRDSNHDGVPEQGKHYTATDILLHPGYDAPADSDHKSSIGCQTTTTSYLSLLLERGKVHDYVLTTAELAIEIMQGFDPGISAEPNA